MGQQWTLALVVVVCAVMLLRLGLGERRRMRFDRWWQRRWQAAAGAWHSLRGRCASRRQASALADDVIRRARGGEWDGNVYRPKSFRGPRKPH